MSTTCPTVSAWQLESTPSRGLEDLSGRGSLKVAIEGSIPPSQLMLAKRVVFLPLFLGILKKARLPRGE
jgi:hypothetical protein